MRYIETLPDDTFSHHVECMWEKQYLGFEPNLPIELMLPTCTFNILIFDQEVLFKIKAEDNWKIIPPGVYFLGQLSQSIYLKCTTCLKVLGIRFKPFAFADIIQTPIYTLTDQLVELEHLFSYSSTTNEILNLLKSNRNTESQWLLLHNLMFSLFHQSLSIDEKLRDQVNYILDRKGVVKISEMFEKFNVSKVTLRNHFINKVGLTPKKVSQIWRLNHVLQMKEEHPTKNLTCLCLEAGFYDQAHFIKEFKMLFQRTPKKFFTQNQELVKIAHQNISKRFTNQYDPRGIA